ncbi:MAG: Crp/Fnr family transcriptional regulator [Rhodobacteraceae bacterium]|nr:Crp/Fnr family transcriptional regulator [Paracoccaceae bacterium]
MGWMANAPELPEFDAVCMARLSQLSSQTLPVGSVLFRPGETAKGFVIVLDGQIDVFLTGPSGRDIQLYVVQPGQSCIQSTLGLLGGEEYSGEAITRTNCKVVLIPRDMFLDLMNLSSEFRTFVFSAFAARMQSMMHLLERIAFQRVECRLAQAMVERAENNTLYATHAEIAVMIGSAREVVSRRLEALAKRGIVNLDRGVVHIIDMQTLEHLAQSNE